MKRLLEHYTDLADGLPLIVEPKYASKVVPTGNAVQPVHRWFHLKEAFAHDLVHEVVADLGIKRRGLLVIDPFAGTGTTIVASTAGQPAVAYGAIGIECNPFLQFVANTKSRAARRHLEDFTATVRAVTRQVRSGRISPGRVPRLSTFSNLRYFDPSMLRDLLSLRSAIDALAKSGMARDLARLCLASVVEPASFLRRDGRALRYVPLKEHVDVIAEFDRRSKIIAEDLEATPARRRGTVLLGDGRDPGGVLPKAFRADLALFSPPYPNNLDYTEIYKLEAWFLGFINDQEQFRQQRLRTLRSHPSVAFPEVYGPSANGHRVEVQALLQPLVESVIANGDYRWRVRLIRGYFDDILSSLINLRRVMNSGAHIAIVVANSLHGSGNDSFVIATDVLTARLAQVAGFTVRHVVVARVASRRTCASSLLRESVIFATHP